MVSCREKKPPEEGDLRNVITEVERLASNET
jgi:hypothetical protein